MLDLTRPHKLRSADILCEKFDGEMVILNLAKGIYFSLNSSASLLLEGMLQGYSLQEMCETRTAACAAGDIVAFFASLNEHELICTDASVSPGPMSDEFAGRLEVITAPPKLEAYSELADLIIGDPVHETEATIGWPAQKVA